MRATEVLQKCLGDALGSMHALRRRVLLRAVEATIHGRRLTLIDLARSWQGAERCVFQAKPATPNDPKAATCNAPNSATPNALKPATRNDLKPSTQNALKSAAKMRPVRRRPRCQGELRAPGRLQHSTDRR